MIMNQTYNLQNAKEATFSDELIEMANSEIDAVLKRLKTQLVGLNEAEASIRIKQYGLNEIAREKPKSAVMHFLNNLKNPLVILLVALAVISYITGDTRATVVISAIVILGVVLRFHQELRANNAAEKLKEMVSNNATVIRDGEGKEIPLNMLVPGDIVSLSAGDMVPADVRVLSAKDLYLNQSALTGESLPVEKNADMAPKYTQNPLEFENLCFLGSNVVSGTAVAVVIHTGQKTYFGSLAKSIVKERELTSFELHYGYLNSYHHTGLKNITDEAILAHVELEEDLKADVKYNKIDEIPFDFTRKRMSVILEYETGLNTLICKGAVEKIMEYCNRVEIDGEVLTMLPEYKESAKKIVSDMNNQGFRVIAIAYKEMPGAPDKPVYEVKDESELVLLAFYLSLIRLKPLPQRL